MNDDVERMLEEIEAGEKINRTTPGYPFRPWWALLMVCRLLGAIVVELRAQRAPMKAETKPVEYGQPDNNGVGYQAPSPPPQRARRRHQ